MTKLRKKLDEDGEELHCKTAFRHRLEIPLMEQVHETVFVIKGDRTHGWSRTEWIDYLQVIIIDCEFVMRKHAH